MPKQIQIIGGELRELDVDEKSVVAIPPGTEIIFEDTLASFAKTAGGTSKKLVDDLVVEKELSDKRSASKGK